MAHAPVVLQSYVALRQVIADYGTFDARTREAIALVVVNVDGTPSPGRSEPARLLQRQVWRNHVFLT